MELLLVPFILIVAWYTFKPESEFNSEKKAVTKKTIQICKNPQFGSAILTNEELKFINELYNINLTDPRTIDIEGELIKKTLKSDHIILKLFYAVNGTKILITPYALDFAKEYNHILCVPYQDNLYMVRINGYSVIRHINNQNNIDKLQ